MAKYPEEAVRNEAIGMLKGKMTQVEALFLLASSPCLPFGDIQLLLHSRCKKSSSTTCPGLTNSCCSSYV